MDAVVWIGVALSLAGIAILLGCILAAVRARRASPDDAALRARLQRILVWNMGALALSAIGLMTVAVGVFLR